MSRLLLILATISVAAVVLALAPPADACPPQAFSCGQSFYAPQAFVQVQPFYAQQFVQPQVVVNSGFAFRQRVAVQAVAAPQVQVNVQRGFGIFRPRGLTVRVR